VEIVAALAVIFQKYSLELAVDDFVGKMSDVEKMGTEERERVYRLAQERCRKRMSEATSVLTLKMQPGEDVPVRLVRRGEEKFVSWIE
jgi:3-methyladenine DNA glycosylase AlkC